MANSSSLSSPLSCENLEVSNFIISSDLAYFIGAEKVDKFVNQPRKIKLEFQKI